MTLFLLCSEVFASAGEHSVSGSVTGIFSFVLFLMILTLALEEKIHAKKSIIVGVFAIVSLLLATYFQILPGDTLENSFHEKITIPIKM